jgi:hypothetical protein
MKLFGIATVFLLCNLSVLKAQSGSLDLEDIQPLLDQQPELWQEVQSAFEIRRIGIGIRMPGGININLAGARIAPYRFSAHAKGGPDHQVIVEVQAQTTFLDAAGRKVSLENATGFKERLVGFLIREPTPYEKKFFEQMPQN